MGNPSLANSQEDRFFIDEVVDLYKTKFPGKGTGFYSKHDWNRLRTAFELGIGTSVLDVGISNGAFLHMLKRSGQYEDICGIDIKDHSMLLLPDGVEHHIMSVCDMALEDNRFDTVFCMEVLEHLDPADLPSALSELRRVCRGRLICSLPFCEPEPLFRSHTQSFDEDKIARIFPTAAFCIVKRPGVDWILIIESPDLRRDTFSLSSFEELLLASDGTLTFEAHGKEPASFAVPSTRTTNGNGQVQRDFKGVRASEQSLESPVRTKTPIDRVSDLYRGKIFNAWAQEACRARIHWLCGQVTGRKVLDIGCSQGISSILLAQEGYEVLGVDLDTIAIEQALAEKAGLHSSVASRLNFSNADIFSSSPEDLGAFDTVILGEILEHFANPENLLEKALTFLKPGGRLVLSTPFGLKPSDDHKYTFTLSSFLELVAPKLSCEALEVEDTYIRFVGILDQNRDSDSLLGTYPSLEELREIETKGLLGVQEALYNTQDEYSARNKKLTKELAKIVQREKLLSEKLSSLRSEHEKTLGQLAQAEDRARGSKSQLSVARQKLLTLGREERRAKNLHTLEMKRIQYLERSGRFQLGSAFIDAVSSVDGLVRFPWRIGKLLMRGVLALFARITGNVRYSPERCEYILILALLERGVTVAHTRYQELLEQRVLDEKILSRVMYDCMKCFSERESLSYGFRALELDPNDAGLRNAVTQTQNWVEKIGGVYVKRSLPQLAKGPQKKGISDGCFFPVPTSRPKSFPKITVAGIFDTFTTHCVDPEVNLVRVKKDSWKKQFEAHKPHFFMAESAWQGNDGEWKYFFNKFDQRDPNPLQEILNYCKDNNIPTVFWNKEDPVNYDVFIRVAREFEYVCTTDADIVDQYKQDLGHDRVFPLAFAAQPLLHNPIRRSKGGIADLIQKGCFAGSWRGDKYAQRGNDFDTLLSPLLPKKLVDIYDRYANHKDRDTLGFPEPYKSAVIGSLPYDELVEKYKEYNFFLNTNSVTESSTMLSRRVFEILASGTPVISTPAKAIDTFFSGEVLQTSSRDETLQYATRLLDDTLYREHLALRGVRKVMRAHTYQSRMNEVISSVVPSLSVDIADPLVSIICVSNRPEYVDRCFENLSRLNYPNFEVVFVVNSEGFEIPKIEEKLAKFSKARLLHCEQFGSLGECLNQAREVISGEYWMKLDDDDFYGPNYLIDQMLAFRYTEASIVGKNSYYCYMEESDELAVRFPGNEYCYSNLVAGATLLVKTKDTSHIPFATVKRGTDTRFQEACRAENLKIFSVDRFNFAAYRHEDVSRHTWAVEREEFLKKCAVVGTGLDQNTLVA